MKKTYCVCCLILFYLFSFGQYRIKDFKDGYVVKNGDTVKCKIYDGGSAGHYGQVVFKYTDSKFEEAAIYFPGSIIKAYGFKGDTALREFIVFEKVKSFSRKKEQVFGELLVKGRNSLVKYITYKNPNNTLLRDNPLNFLSILKMLL